MASSGAEAAAGAAAAAGGDGPVMSMMNKRLRALRKKYNRILQMEESVAQGKLLNKEQEEVLRSKAAVAVLIDEYEKLRQPLAAAVEEEIARGSSSASRPPSPPLTPTVARDEPPASPAATTEKEEEPDRAVKDLVTLLYFGHLFDVKSQSEFAATMLTKTHERGCCLTYDYVTDDATDLLGERDLDEISALGSLVTSRPVYSGVSHKNALHECIQHAKFWLLNSDQYIHPEASITYAGLREKLNKILASDYFTTTPEMKAPGDVAAAVEKYGTSHEVQVSDSTTVPSSTVKTEVGPVEEDEQQEIQAEPDHQVSVVDEPSKTVITEQDEADLLSTPTDAEFNQEEQHMEELDAEEQNQKDAELKEQLPYSRRSYHNQRGGARGGAGGGRRGYANGRGGRGGRGGGVGYQNGRGQYYDSGYYPRSYYNSRGRGGRSGGSTAYANHGGPPAGHIPANVE